MTTNQETINQLHTELDKQTDYATQQTQYIKELEEVLEELIREMNQLSERVEQSVGIPSHLGE